MFYNIAEPSQENCENSLKAFLREEMKVSENDLKGIRFDRVHRIGRKQSGRNRVMIAKFNPSNGKEVVLRHIKNLNKTKKFGVNEQLPKELEERKKHLLPKYCEARDQDNKPKWSMDKLIVGSKVTQVKRDSVKDLTLDTMEMATKLILKHAPPSTYNGSTFQGHHRSIQSQDDIVPVLHALYKDPRVARAKHNIYAYRLQVGNNVLEHYEDDGEYGAGRRVLQLLRDNNITGKIVCVSRWYGGVNLGEARFGHIKEAARKTLGLQLTESTQPKGSQRSHHQRQQQHQQQQHPSQTQSQSLLRDCYPHQQQQQQNPPRQQHSQQYPDPTQSQSQSLLGGHQQRSGDAQKYLINFSDSDSDHVEDSNHVEDGEVTDDNK